MSSDQIPPSAPSGRVYVHNDSLRPLVLHPRDPKARRPKPGEPPPKRPPQIVLAPGLNICEAEPIAWCKLDVGDVFEGCVRVVDDPAALPEHLAIKLAAETSARNAVRAWLDVERRPKVVAALRKRLAMPSLAQRAAAQAEAGE